MAARFGDPCGFDILFGTHVPHILEKIFLYLDYESFKTCTEVNSVWKRQLTSESFQEKAKSMFQEEIIWDEIKLKNLSRMGKANEVKRMLSNCPIALTLLPWSHTPLFEAASHGHKDVVEILLGGGADPNKLSCGFMAPLHHAALGGHHDMAQLLLHSGADPNIVNGDGRTPVHFSIIGAAKEVIEERYREVIQLLLDNGGDPKKEDNEGKTPLSFALKKGDIFVLKMIEEATEGLDV